MDPTSDPKYSHGIDIYVNEILIDNKWIETYDFWNGLIILKYALNPEDKIEITYLYEQIKAVIPDVNLNPIYPEQLNDPGTEFIECLK